MVRCAVHGSVKVSIWSKDGFNDLNYLSRSGGHDHDRGWLSGVVLIGSISLGLSLSQSKSKAKAETKNLVTDGWTKGSY